MGELHNYIPWFVGVAVAAATVFFGGGWFRRLAWRIGLIDRPKLRGVHGDAIARSGGLAISAALVLALLAQLATARAMDPPGQYLDDLNNVYLLLPALALMGLGLLDDLRPMGARAKLVVQALCAWGAYAVGFRIDEVNILGVVQFSTGYFDLPLTMLFIIALTNAFNMLDGIDGLCAGTACVALTGIGVYALFGGGLQYELALPLAAAALAFLRSNFGKPKSFLGDSGSTFLGFLIATLALGAVRTPGKAIDVAPLFLLLSLPVVDITTVVLRRTLQGSNPLAADRGHIHHIALILFNHKALRATLTLLAIAATAALGAVVAGIQPGIAAALMAAPLGLYAMIYARGGYLSWANLHAAGAASDVAKHIANSVPAIGPVDALTGDKAIRLMQLLRITAIGLIDDKTDLVWCIGVPDLKRDALELPLYAVGRVKRGVLLVQGPGRDADRLAFAAQLLIPLYPAFMELLESRTRATRNIPKPMPV